MKISYVILLISSFVLSSCFSKVKLIEINYTLLEQGFPFDVNSDTLVIKNQNDLMKLKSDKAPEVDLNIKTILGFKGTTTGCKYPAIDIKVVRDDPKKKYIVNAIVYQDGLCKKLILYQRIFTIDKMKKNYQVVFQTTNILKNKMLLDSEKK